jgi:NADH-quinone oxidoreductase subunit H
MNEIIYAVIKTILFLILLLITIIFYTLWERKLIGFIQNRIGPNKTGPYGLLQPIADTLKLLLKSIIFPKKANKLLFILSPIIVVVAAISSWAVIPFSYENNLILSNLNLSLLYLLAFQCLGVNAIIIAGWASNSKYALLGSIRAAAQMISYSIPLGLSIVGVLIKSNSMNLSKIVIAQSGGMNNWFCVSLFPFMIIYWICSLAETNRLPFDVAEGESELVAGFHVEYSGITFALFFLAEYSNMILASVLTSILFFGGWLSPFTNHLSWVPNICWIFVKTFIFMTLFIWIRATLPRLRYDQVMSFCWKCLTPLALICIFIQVIFSNTLLW